MGIKLGQFGEVILVDKKTGKEIFTQQITLSDIKQNININNSNKEGENDEHKQD